MSVQMRFKVNIPLGQFDTVDIWLIEFCFYLVKMTLENGKKLSFSVICSFSNNWTMMVVWLLFISSFEKQRLVFLTKYVRFCYILTPRTSNQFAILKKVLLLIFFQVGIFQFSSAKWFFQKSRFRYFSFSLKISRIIFRK